MPDFNIENFINRLAKPIMVYRFAKAQIDHTYKHRPNSRAGAQKRMENAERDIKQIITEYVESDGWIKHET